MDGAFIFSITSANSQLDFLHRLCISLKRGAGKFLISSISLMKSS